MIRCSYCASNMYIGPSRGNTRTLLYARCDNPNCTRRKKSIRVKVIFDYIYHLLEKGLNFTEEDYKQYYGDLTKTAERKRQKTTIEIHSKQAILKGVDRELRERSLGITKLEKDSIAWKITEDKIGELSNQKVEIEGKVTDLQKTLRPEETERLSIEEFLNLSKNAARIVQAADAVVKDAICRQIFLNFSVDEEKVLSYQAKEPFATLLKQRELLSSADDRT
ncbi:MAG: hypothetical protein NTY06_04630, partial [Candidatus Gottesmanbacteria bacterium]|nr:hypothetical protein [Candidatus Gottesmanbacteria bacterium]